MPSYFPPPGHAVDYTFSSTPPYGPPSGHSVNFGLSGSLFVGVAEVSKLVGYAVLKTPVSANASKLLGYAILTIEAARASKVLAYAVLKGTNTGQGSQTFTIT